MQPGTAVPWELMYQHVLPGTAEGCVPQYIRLSGLFWGEEDATRAAHLPAAPREQLPTKSICCPGTGAVGATGGNSHLAGFKTKVQSWLPYYQSGNGHNRKFFGFKKKRKKETKITFAHFLPHTFIWWKIWYKRELHTSENLARVSAQYKIEWRKKKPSSHAHDDP